MIIVFGEILLDVYDEYKKIGGAPFNFAFHLSSFDLQTSFVSRIGNDDNGKLLLDFLNQNKIDIKNVQIDSVKSTGYVEVKLENGIPDYEITKDVSYDYIDYEHIQFPKDIQVQLLYIGTLIQRNTISRNSFKKLYNQFSKAKCFYDVNLRKDNIDFEVIKETLLVADIVKMNDEELEFVCNSLNFKNKNEQEQLLYLSENYQIECICITKGSKGSILFLDNNFYFHHNNESKSVIDTVGAGDAYSSILAIGLIKDWNPKLIVNRASMFAADICNVSGAIPDDKVLYNKYADWFD